MSTATVAAGNVRPFSAIKADYANALATKPQAILADVKAAITWLPRKAQAAIMRTARFLHVPQLAAFVARNFSRFLGLVGKGAFLVEVLTSHWGQATIKKGIEVSAAVTKFAVKWAWRIATSPLRLFTPTRTAVARVEAAVTKANNKLTPNSGEAFGPVQLVHDVAGHYVSADRTHMRLARTTAIAVMTLRVTRRFVPIGWLRVLTYGLDGIMIARAYGEILENTWLVKKIDNLGQKKLIEADVIRQKETVVAEATNMTRDAASDTASKLRAKADKVEAEGLQAAKAARDEMASVAVTQADELRSEASALEATAERMAAADTAIKVVETLQTTPEAPVAPEVSVLRDLPTPGPVVPPAAPTTGPQQPQAHQRHGGKGNKPPQKR